MMAVGGGRAVPASINALSTASKARRGGTKKSSDIVTPKGGPRKASGT